jgi:hypothetical protein
MGAAAFWQQRLDNVVPDIGTVVVFNAWLDSRKLVDFRFRHAFQVRRA